MDRVCQPAKGVSTHFDAPLLHHPSNVSVNIDGFPDSAYISQLSPILFYR